MARPIASNATAIAVASAASAVLLAVAIGLWQIKRSKEKKVRIPDKWRRVGTLSELILYPVKSGSALSLDRGDCTELGLRTTPDNNLQLRDRLFVIVDAEGRIKTARQHGNMLFIQVSQANESSVTFQAPKMSDLTVSLAKPDEAKRVTVTMWKEEKVHGLDCGEEAAQWVQAYVGQPGLRLVYYDPEALGKRSYSKEYFSPFLRFYRKIRPFDRGGYTDFAAYHLINTGSVEDLKEHLGESTPADFNGGWFRPTFLISGPDAFAEDSWDLIRIGDDAVLQSNNPCTRCIFPTINPATGLKSSNMEPLKMLRKYRAITNPEQLKFENPTSPLMGLYMGLRRPGVVKTGDAVYVPDE